MNNAQQARQINKDLKLAIANDNQTEILNIYERAELVEWQDVHDSIFQQYDDLIDDANNLLLT
jgi:hypothetical protein